MLALRQGLSRSPKVAPAVKPGPIGVDFSRDQLHLVQLALHRETHIQLQARASMSYPGGRQALLSTPKALRPFMRRALKSDAFSGKRAVSALPPEDVRILSVAYHAGGDNDAKAILGQLDERLDGRVSDYVVDYLPVRTGQGDEERLAMVAVAQRSAVIRHLDLLRGVGLEPQALEIGPAAIKRLIGALSQPNLGAVVLVINFGRSKSYLTMISGRRLLFDQGVAFGEEGLLQRLSESLDLSLERSRDLVFRHGLDPGVHGGEEAAAITGREVSETLVEIVKPQFLKLVDEINRTLIYAASETRGKPVTRIYLLGSIARWRGADALLGSLLNISVATVPDPLQPFRRQQTDRELAGVPEIAVATGLALRGMGGDD